MAELAEQLLTVRQLSKVMQVHPNTIRKLVKNSAMPSLKIGNTFRFHPADINQWIKTQTEKR